MLSRRALLAATVAVPFIPATSAFAQDAGGDVDPKLLAPTGPLKDISLGKPDAPVKVYEYASMTCPHCANFAKTVFPEIKTKYIDTGKVLWTMREYPLDPRATAGFMLARCAGDDKYYAMLDVLFAQQDNWAFVEQAQVLPGMLQIARQAGLTEESFNTCLKNKELFDGVNAIKNYATDKLNITGTPTFFINGKRKSGEMNAADFAAVVDPLVK